MTQPRTPDPDRWARIEAIFAKALAADPETWDAVLEESCGTDRELQQEVERLIRAHASADDALESLARRLGIPSSHSAETSLPAQRRFGAYRLLREIGRGGMGAVYLAERADGEFTKEVAVKLLPIGLGTPAARERFLAERQILAQLDHPKVARLLDAGVAEDGTPFFVMEYIEGKSLTRYCDDAGYGVEQRIDLFLQVCEAVEYAHRNLVVHRDLKPGNILVTEEGQVKLLDFGIAKVLDAGTAGEPATLTRMVGQPLTPAYASPEQLRGEPVTTATDVYALGVLLYELLAGRPPFQVSGLSPTELERVVCTTDPQLPSAAAATTATARHDPDGSGSTMPDATRRARRLQGDLDTIILMALRKEPDRRYASVSALVDDLRRYRNGLPVAARPNRLSYRIGKFARRRPGVITAGAAAMLAVVGYGATVTAYAERLAVERNLAQAEAGRAEGEVAKSEEVTAFLLSLFEAADPARGGRHLTAGELLDRGAARVDALSAEPEVQGRMLTVVSGIYSALGSYEEAVALAERSVTLHEEVYERNHPAVGESLFRLGEALWELGHLDEAESVLRQAWRQQELALGGDHPAVGRTISTLGILRWYQIDLAEAESLLRQAFGIQHRALGPEHAEVARTLYRLGIVLTEKWEYDRAEEDLRRALAIQRELPVTAAPDLARTLFRLGMVHDRRGEWERAEQAYREALDIQIRVFGDRHPDVARTLYGLGVVMSGRRDFAAAEELHGRALEIQREVLGDHMDLAMTHFSYAHHLYRRGDVDGATQHFRECARIRETLTGPDHPILIAPLVQLGSMLRQKGELQESEEVHRRVLSLRRALRGEPSSDVAASLTNLGRVAGVQRRFEEADSLLQRGLAMQREIHGEEHLMIARTLNLTGDLLRIRGRYDDARPYFEQALAMQRSLLGERHQETAMSLQNLGLLFRDLGQREQSISHLRDALEIRSRGLGPDHPWSAATRAHLAALTTDATDELRE